MFYLLVVVSAICFGLLCSKISHYVSSKNMLFKGFSWERIGVIDTVRILIYLMLLVCFAYARLYTNHYFSGDANWLNLYYIICAFVLVMASLVFTGDYLSSLIFWEYLGVVRYFLILFYLRYLSLRSSVVTLVSSRFGDVCLFLLIAVGAYRGGCNQTLGLILFLLVVLTKRAGFPFISWLLEAMRAPTPVRSLVHSSTLVAAGVWFSMRYDMFKYTSNFTVPVTLLLSTTFITGVCCFFFLDLKKIVALSTCKNISWCLLYLIFGDVTLSLFQLVSHGVSKCLLFILVGDVMRGSGGAQASNGVYSPALYGRWPLFSLISISLGLSGAPFIGVFFSKHLMLTKFSDISNIALSLFTIICVMFSYVYTFRLCAVLLKTKATNRTGSLFSFRAGMMVFFWLFIKYLITSSLREYSHLSSKVSTLLLLFQVIALLLAYFAYRRTLFRVWSSRLFGCDKAVESGYDTFIGVQSRLRALFFRWDSQLINLFNGVGSSTIPKFKVNLINVNLFALLGRLIALSLMVL